MTANDTQSGGDEFEPDPRRWIALFTLLIAGFMNLIDVTIVNVALPALQSGLGATSSQIEWIVAGYVLAFALALLPLGRLGDIVGRRKMFLLGVSAFTLMSTAAGLAPNIELLVVTRVLQGLSGAMMMPQVLAITNNIFPPHERGMAFSLFGLSASTAAVAGPVIGGALISADLFGMGWRPIFLINVPIGIFAVIAGLRLIPDIKGNADLKNDWLGIVLAGLAVLFLVFPLIEGRALGWPVWTLVMMAASVPAAATFVWWQRRRRTQSKAQLLPFSLLTNRNYMIGTAATVAFFSGIPGFFMVFALFLQNGFGLTPLQSGLTTTPFPLGIFAASYLSGRLGPRWMKQRLMAGAIILAIGMIFARQTVLGVDEVIEQSAFIAPLLFAGIGMGLTIAVLFQSILANVPAGDSGSGSGALQAFQQMGGAIGVAMMGQIFFATLTASGRPEHADFIAAVGEAMIYNIIAFLLVVVLSAFMSTPGVPLNRGRPQPVAAE